MIRIAAVSYLNTKPFEEGLRVHFEPSEIELSLLNPAECAEAFLSEKADVALIPAGSLPDWDVIHILDGYCIGAEGSVDSVYLFAQQPIDRIETVFTDPHSRTSNGLAKVLFKKHWRKKVNFLTENDYFERITGTAAGVIIGDRAVAVKNHYPYAYDLAAEWAAFTGGLPFAFAVWVYEPDKISRETVARLQTAFRTGMNSLKTTAQKWASNFGLSVEAAEKYLTQSISYDLNEQKKNSLAFYLKLLTESNPPIPVYSGFLTK